MHIQYTYNILDYFSVIIIYNTRDLKKMFIILQIAIDITDFIPETMIMKFAN
jgi:hypothetical protein